MIAHSRPTLGEAEEQAVLETVRSGQIAQGIRVERFEAAFSRYLGGPHAACTCSGTSALHLTLLAMEVGPGDEVILPSYVCTALLNAVNYIGAAPVLADIDPETGNIDPADAKKRISGKTRAVVVPHLFGLPADMNGLLSLGIPVIEDCAQAVGSEYAGSKSGTLGHAAIFSFYATKVMTTAEGGLVVSRSKALIDRVKDLRDYDEKDMYIPRFNYKMSDINAAMGLVQLSRLADFIRRRREIAETYDTAFHHLKAQKPLQTQGHIYFRYVLGLNRDAGPIIDALCKAGIGCARPIYRPIHDFLGLTGYPQTTRAWRQAMSIPIYPLLGEKEIRGIIEAVNRICADL